MTAPKPVLLPGLLIGLVAFVGAWIGSRTHGPPEPEVLHPRVVRIPPELEAQLTKLAEGLARLDERLGAREARLRPDAVSDGPGDGGRVPVVEASATRDRDLLAAILRLEDAVSLLLEDPGDRMTRIERLRREKPEADWIELDALLALHATDEEAARKEVLLLSEEQVLRRFGSPNLMFTNAKGKHWVYGRGYDPTAEAYSLQLVLVLSEGYVSTLYVDGL